MHSNLIKFIFEFLEWCRLKKRNFDFSHKCKYEYVIINVYNGKRRNSNQEFNRIDTDISETIKYCETIIYNIK